MNPLIFFIVIIGIDLLLKSVKDKKKIEEERLKKMQELKNKENIKTIKDPGGRKKREIKKNPILARKEKDGFFGEGKSYGDSYTQYEDRYDMIDESYDSIDRGFDIMDKSYDNKVAQERGALYDPNAIQTSSKKEYKELDVRNYGKNIEKIDIPLAKASTFKKDVLNGIIFSEILGKPKSLQKK